MPRDPRRPFSAGPIAWLLLAAVLLAGCQTAGKKKSGPPWLNVPPEWMEPGTVVIYMPRAMASAKATSGDPTYHNWAEALLEYADTSALAKSVVDEGRYLSRQVKISPKTVPSSDYSILIVGPAGQGVHVMEPWEDLVDFLKVDDYLLGRATLDSLPKGCEALRLRVPGDSLADEALPTLDGELPDPTLFDETAALDEESPPAAEQEKPVDIKEDKAAARKAAKEEKARLKAEEREQARQKKAEQAAREEKERQEKKEAKLRQQAEEEAREQAEKEAAEQRSQEAVVAAAVEREAKKKAKAEQKAAKAAKEARPDEKAPAKPAADDKPSESAEPEPESKPKPEAVKKSQPTAEPDTAPEPEKTTPTPARKKPSGAFKLFD